MAGDAHIRKRIFSILAGVFILAGVALMAYSIFRVQKTTLDDERNQMLLIAKSTGKSVENYLSGSFAGIELVRKSAVFLQAVERYHVAGLDDALMLRLRSMASEDYPGIADVVFTDDAGNTLLSTAPDSRYRRLDGDSGDMFNGKFRIYRRDDGGMYLGMPVSAGEGFHLLCLLDVERMYEYTAAFANIGGKGYIMFKHSDGIILSHPAADQVGVEVLSGRRERFPDLDFSDLELLIANQEQGKEGIQIYHSYWWTESPPPRVKKISAFTPVRAMNDFIIVSAVTDYADLLRPVQMNSFAIIASAVLASLGVMALLYRYRLESQRKVEEENEYLRQLNRSLDEMARRQEELRHSQRLQLIGTLTGGIAHEFRNLLTPIMGYAGLLRETLPPESPIREDIEEIYGSAVKAKEIIQQVMILSRKSVSPEFKPLCLDDVIPGTLKVANASKPPDYEIGYDLDFGENYVMANRTQIAQIVLNLCYNAFQAKREGPGHLWIRGWAARENGGKFAILQFTDDGVGMAPEVLQRIFDPFFTTKRVGEGTGLGLSVVQSIVELHNGTIEARSELGSGTVFTLRFPLVSSDGSDTEDIGDESVMGLEAQEIVLIERDDEDRVFLKKGLEKRGFIVRAFANQQTARDDMAARSCRLLITTYTTSGGSGLDLARDVKVRYPGTKVLVLTAHVEPDILESLQSNAIDGYQIKPAQLSEVVEKIMALLTT